VDRMAAEAQSWAVGTVAEAATDGRLLAAATAWDPERTRSTAVGMSIVVPIRIGTATTSTHIGTAIRTLPTVVLAGGGLRRGACGCAATGARPTAIGTATGRMADTAIIVRTAAILVRPTDVVPPTDTDAGKVIAERDKCGPSSSPARGAGEPLSGAGLC
jgi:hypothetical protein